MYVSCYGVVLNPELDHADVRHALGSNNCMAWLQTTRACMLTAGLAGMKAAATKGLLRQLGLSVATG
jgi:hypothetical protein